MKTPAPPNIPDAPTALRAKPRHRVWLGLSVASIALITAVSLTVPMLLAAGPDGATKGAGVPAAGQLPYTVTSGPLTISVIEAGTIMSKDPLVISSDVQRRVPILFLVDEGTFVEEGDLLVELDGTHWQDEITRQSTVVENGEANLIRAREDLAIARNQAEADISSAELALTLAEQDYRKYMEGEHPRALMAAENKITLAREDLKQANVRLEGSRQLYDRKYISFSELEKDELAAKRAGLDVEMAQEDLNLLVDYTHPRRVLELENDVKQKRLALERTNRRAAANVLKEETDVRARESEQLRNEKYLEFCREQLAKCRITAPKAGRVVYAGNGDRDEPLEPGVDVWHRRELVQLPDRSAMIAEVKIHESNLDQVRVGLPVRITVDAMPGRTLTGRVADIARYPDRRRWWQPDLKVYSTKIEIDNTDDALRTGMSCTVEVLIDYYRDAVYVPIQAVVSRQGEDTAYVRSGDRYVPRVVETGLDNNRMVHVISGLKPGDIVTLKPPLEDSTVEEKNKQTDEDPAFQADWSEALVDAAREARAASEKRDQARSLLSDDDLVLLERLQAAKDRQVLDRVPMDDEVREAVNGWLTSFANSEPITIDQQLAAKARSAVEKFVNRMRNRRPGGGEGHGGDGAGSNGGGGQTGG